MYFLFCCTLYFLSYWSALLRCAGKLKLPDLWATCNRNRKYNSFTSCLFLFIIYNDTKTICNKKAMCSHTDGIRIICGGVVHIPQHNYLLSASFQFPVPSTGCPIYYRLHRTILCSFWVPTWDNEGLCPRGAWGWVSAKHFPPLHIIQAVVDPTEDENKLGTRR